MRKKLICIGNGSVAKICIDILKKKKIYNKIKIVKITNKNKKFKLVKLYNKIKGLENTDFILGFASIKDLKVNKIFFDFLKKKGCKFKNVIHETAILDKKIKLGSGVKIYPGVIINKGCKIKENVLINTGSIIDHDCEIGTSSQIAPGCRLAGNIKIGKLTLIGIGTTIIQGLKIGDNCVVGAGSVVTKDIPNNSIYAGIPAKSIK